MPEPPASREHGTARLRFTRFGLSIGVAAAGAILFIVFMLYLPGTQTQEGAASASETARVMAMIAGLPTSLVSVRFVDGLDGLAAWAGIAAIPILNGVVLGAVADIGSAVTRRSA